MQADIARRFFDGDHVGADDECSGSDDAMDAEERDEEANDLLHNTGGSYADYQRPVVLYRNFDSVTGRSLHRPKTRRRKWTQRDMTNAFNAVKYQGMSLRGAATAFNVPESTLRDRVHGRVSLECSRPGPPTFFTYEEEKKMVDHMLFMSKIGYPYTRNQVVELAGDMTKAVGRIAPFKYLNPSQAWFYAFLNRWPDLRNFLFGPRSTRKSKGVSGDSIQSYFEQLEKVLNRYEIKDKPEHFWIVDEVSISCENQPPRILPINVQRAQSVSYWNPTVAVLGAANGAGDKIPPFLIYRGESVIPTMMEGSVRGTKFSYSPSGWVNSDAFIQWFVKHFRVLVSLRPLILFYDGHLQFVSVRVLERAREEGVFLFPLPPHPAYNHCMENTCFWAFEHYFKKRLERFLDRNPKQQLTRINAAPVLTHAYEKALQSSNMIQLFERLGICPFNNLSNSIGAYLNMADEYDQQVNGGGDGFAEDMHASFDSWYAHSPHLGQSAGWAKLAYPGNLVGHAATGAAGSFLHFPAGSTGLGDQHQAKSAVPPGLPAGAAASAQLSAAASAATAAATEFGGRLLQRAARQAATTLVASSVSTGTGTPPGLLQAQQQQQQQTVIQLPTAHPDGKSRVGRPIMVGPIRIQGGAATANGTPLRYVSGRLDGKALPIHKQQWGDKLELLENCTVDPSEVDISHEEEIPCTGTAGGITESAVASGGPPPPSSSSSSSAVEAISRPGGTGSPPAIATALTYGGMLVETPDGNDEDGLAGTGSGAGIHECCVVCGQLEPPESACLPAGSDRDTGDDLQVVDWVHCDYCDRWLHWNGTCSEGSVIVGNSFMCVVCRQAGTTTGSATAVSPVTAGDVKRQSPDRPLNGHSQPTAPTTTTTAATTSSAGIVSFPAKSETS